MKPHAEYPKGKADETVLYEAHPSMFKSNPIMFLLCVFLIAAYGVGVVILFIWWLLCIRRTLTITNERITLRIGMLSKHVNEIHHSDVRNIKLKQRFLQRILGSGSIAIGSAATGTFEIVVKGIPYPDKAKELIETHRR